MTASPVRLKIKKLVGGGLGLAHDGDRTWLVAGALPGETVDAEKHDERRGVVHAAALRVAADPHPLRAIDPCPHAAICGGCDWPHVTGGAALKAEVAAESARGRRELADRLRTAPVRSSPPAYRLRARLHWDPQQARLGFYEPRSWRVAGIDGCRIISPQLGAALPRLESSLERSCPAPVDVEWLENLSSSGTVAALRPTRRGPREVDPLWTPSREDLEDAVGGFHVLSRAGRLRPVWGSTTVTMGLPRPLDVPIGAFFQGNRHLVPWLYGRVAEICGPDPAPTWDLHAGVGFLAAAAFHASPRQLRLVEPFRPAARAARGNLPEAREVAASTAEAYLGRQSSLPEEALAITDPPRAGLSAALRRGLARWRPQRILMLSCDPATWARDADDLLGHGYHLASLELIDLFPSTHHVEVLAMLEAE